MTDARATATVVSSPDAEATYALVNDPQHVAFLQQECRIYGSPEGSLSAAATTPQRLRLALEEMAVGVVKGFLRLEATAIDSDGSRIIAEDITKELQGKSPNGGATWRLSLRRRERLQVFHDLWERGYVVTFGSKFGADFLIYKDDPKRSHAVSLIVVKGYEEEFARVDVVSFCRVAKMVKKQLMFACVRNDEGVETGDEQGGDDGGSGAAEVAAQNVEYVSLTHALLVPRQEETKEELE